MIALIVATAHHLAPTVVTYLQTINTGNNAVVSFTIVQMWNSMNSKGHLKVYLLRGQSRLSAMIFCGKSFSFCYVFK